MGNSRVEEGQLDKSMVTGLGHSLGDLGRKMTGARWQEVAEVQVKAGCNWRTPTPH